MSLFNKAKKEQVVTKKSKSDEKVRVRPSEIDQDELFDILSEMAELQAKEKALQAKYAMLSDEVRTLGKEEFAKLFTETGKYPGSFMIEAEKGMDVAQIMFLPTDRYIKINELEAGELREEFGDDIVTEETSFGFNAKMLEKYEEEISEAILNSNIPDKDKGKIIEAKTTYTVAKGTVEKMDKYGDIETVMEKVRPVVMLKGAEVING